LSSKIDDLFLEDEGSGRYSDTDDVEISGSGGGKDNDDTEVEHPITKAPAAKEPKAVNPDDIISKPEVTEDIGFEETNNENNQIFNVKEESPASFFSQPGILAGMLHISMKVTFVHSLGSDSSLHNKQIEFLALALSYLGPIFCKSCKIVCQWR